MCYSNRSLCLVTIERYEAAIADCTRALEYHYPLNKVHKVYYRRGWCHYTIGRLSEAQQDFEAGLKAIAAQGAFLALSEKQQLLTYLEKTQEEIKSRKGKKQPRTVLKGDTAQAGGSIKNVNSSLAHASNRVKLISDPSKGRHLVATSNITIGEEVVKEEAYAAVLLRECETTRCHHCFKEVQLIPYVCGDSKYRVCS